MSLFSKLTAAESYLILANRNATLKELLKYTFLDLVCKKVLRTIETKKQTHKKDKVRTYIYVRLGDEYENYIPKSYEKIFLKPFKTKRRKTMLLSKLLEVVWGTLFWPWRYPNHYLRNSVELKGFFVRGLQQRLSGKLELTEEGENAKTELESNILKLEKELPALKISNPEEAESILLSIGSNRFLLDNLSYDPINLKDTRFLKEFNRNYDLAMRPREKYREYGEFEI